MARIRTIKPEFWTDSLMVQLPHMTRLFYIALWNAADDHGFVRDEPERLAMELMPREDPLDIDASIQALAAAGRLEWYVCEDGSSYYRVARWEEHQRVDHPAVSKVSRDGSRKFAIPLEARRAIAEKYGCAPGKQKDVSCFYCGQAGQVFWFKLKDGRPSSWVVFPGLEVDHLEAEAGGGAGHAENLVLSCRRCNRSKGTTHWFDFLSSRALASPRESSRVVALERKGKEQGKERNGRRRVNAPPVETEWLEYVESTYPDWPKADALSAHGWYESKAWHGVKDWRACVKTCYYRWAGKPTPRNGRAAPSLIGAHRQEIQTRDIGDAPEEIREIHARLRRREATDEEVARLDEWVHGGVS